MSKEKYEQALNILAHYHAGGDRNNTTVLFEFQEIKETIELEFQFKRGGSYLDFLKTRGNRYRLMLLVSLGLISQYSGNALFSNYSNLIYERAGVKEQAQKIGVSQFHSRHQRATRGNPVENSLRYAWLLTSCQLDAGQNVLKLVVALTSAMFIDRVGRRPLFLFSTIGELHRSVLC